MTTRLRLSGAQVTQVKALLDNYFDANTELDEQAHKCDVQCSDQCDREVDVVGVNLEHPTQVLIEDLVERILELL